MQASHFVWEAAGRPPLVGTDGTPILPRRFQEPGHCASCGSITAPYSLDDAISENFTTVRNNNILWPYGGHRICHPCAWTCKTLALRCAMGFAKKSDETGPGGVWFLPLVVLSHDMGRRLAATWAFNKARGVHAVDLDAEIIRKLIEQGVDEPDIAVRLGVDLDTIHRYKQVTGIAALFAKTEYSRSWKMVDDADADDSK